MGGKLLAKYFIFITSTILLHSTICPVKSQLSESLLILTFYSCKLIISHEDKIKEKM